MREAHIVMDNVKDEFKVKATYEVDIIRIADYIKNIVGTRSVPEGKKGVVVMKLDVEGKEIPIKTVIIVLSSVVGSVLLIWALFRSWSAYRSTKQLGVKKRK